MQTYVRNEKRVFMIDSLKGNDVNTGTSRNVRATDAVEGSDEPGRQVPLQSRGAQGGPR